MLKSDSSSEQQEDLHNSVELAQEHYFASAEQNMVGVPHILTTPFSQITDILSSTPVSRKDNENIKQF